MVKMEDTLKVSFCKLVKLTWHKSKAKHVHHRLRIKTSRTVETFVILSFITAAVLYVSTVIDPCINIHWIVKFQNLNDHFPLAHDYLHGHTFNSSIARVHVILTFLTDFCSSLFSVTSWSSVAVSINYVSITTCL